MVEHVRDALGRDQVSKRRACRVLGQPRSTQRRAPHVPDEEPRLVKRMIELATQYGRYGYRMITGMLRNEGWRVNHKRIERLWRREGLKVPQKQPKWRRIWLNDGSCVRLRLAYKDHVWSYDFVQDRTSDGRAFRMLTLIDEHSRECLAIDVARRLNSENVLERLSDLFVRRGVPDYIRSDNGPEFTAKKVTEWLERVEVKTLFIEPSSPWENGYNESFNGTLSCSTHCWRPKCWSSVGVKSTTRSVRTVPWATVRQLPSPSGLGLIRQDGAYRMRISSKEMIC